ncbi:hypothetical protein OQA88_11252 [Cercophora sp. LCS_1]
MNVAVFNPYNPLCVVNQCLDQVVGVLSQDPAAQYSSCVSILGTPTVTTVTPSADVIFSTSMTTVEYIDLVVTTSTLYSTYESVLTSFDYDVESTATSYTTTLVTSTTSTAYNRLTGQKRKLKKRGCKPRPTSRSSALISSALSSTESTAPSASSVASVAPACSNVDEYSSACSCIYAVLDTSTETAPIPTSTSVVHQVVSSAIPVTSESVITAVVTTILVVPTTTTVTSVLQTYTESIDVTIETQWIGNPRFVSGPNFGRFLHVDVDGYWGNPSTNEGHEARLTNGVGQPFSVQGEAPRRLWLEGTDDEALRPLKWATDEQVADSPDTYNVVSCDLSLSGYNQLTCTAPDDFQYFYYCPSVDRVFMAKRDIWGEACGDVVSVGLESRQQKRKMRRRGTDGSVRGP